MSKFGYNHLLVKMKNNLSIQVEKEAIGILSKNTVHDQLNIIARYVKIIEYEVKTLAKNNLKSNRNAYFIYKIKLWMYKYCIVTSIYNFFREFINNI